MNTTLIAGPFADPKTARDTAKYLGESNHCAVGFARKDSEGFNTDECDWFVERDNSIVPTTIFGYESKSFMARQYK